VTETQIEQAEKDAQRDASEWKLMLLLLIGSRVVFRPDVGRFYIDGESVSITTIRDYVRRIEARTGRRLTKLTNGLQRGEITPEEWQRGFERNITSAHVLTAALALGSIKAAIANDEVRARIDAELDYAAKFGREKKELSEKQIASRSRSYLLAAAVTYGILEQMARGLMGKYTECRRIRRASESCPGCVAYAYRWMPIAEMPRLGSLQCGQRCRCYLEYR
jgi:hypothetical protein